MSDKSYMMRALELAQLGTGSVSPNPLVGCVIVHEGKIIGEGHHQRFGEAHAEVNAINSVENSALLSSSTVYVTLEPCAHHGKTPPCADLLIEKKVKRVVIASEDPFKEVSGKGIQKLKDAGIQVEVGLLEKEANEQNRRFRTYIKENRPYIILKWAETSDGFIARENNDSKWISNGASRQLVHKWRTEEDAILVGKKTALHDNPQLTAREWKGKNPVRVLLDRNLEVDSNAALFDQAAKTIVFNEVKSEESDNIRWIQVNDFSPAQLTASLRGLEIQSVIIEGGRQTLNSFIKEDCWDEARVFISDKTFGNGIKAPEITGDMLKKELIFEDCLKIYRNNHG